jgi:AraC-like DNA-binding protein
MFNVEIGLKGVTTCFPEWQIDEQGSPQHRLYYIYSGRILYTDGGGAVRNLMPGSLYLLPIHRQYTLRKNKTETLKKLWVHVGTFPLIRNDMLSIVVPSDSPMHCLLEALKSVILQDQEDTFLLESVVDDIFYLVSKQEGLVCVEDTLIEKVLNYIDNHYSEQLANYELCRVIGLEKKYFIRIFKKNLGITPQRYIANYKMAKAKSMLLSGMLVKEVATGVGFADTKSFSRFFKRNAFISPSEYCEKYRVQPTGDL